MDSRTFGKLTTVLIFGLLVARLQWPSSTSVHGVLYSASVIVSAAAAVDYYLARHSRIMRGPAESVTGYAPPLGRGSRRPSRRGSRPGSGRCCRNPKRLAQTAAWWLRVHSTKPQ